MRYKKKLFLLIPVLIITSCQNNINVDLGGKYKLITSASMNDLTIVDENNIVAIHGHILVYAFDSTFIVVAQRPRDSVPGMGSMTQNKYEKAFEKSTFRQYWIINKKEKSEFNEATKKYSNVYGPFQKDEYLRKREEIGIPESLNIKMDLHEEPN